MAKCFASTALIPLNNRKILFPFTKPHIEWRVPRGWPTMHDDKHRIRNVLPTNCHPLLHTININELLLADAIRRRDDKLFRIPTFYKWSYKHTCYWISHYFAPSIAARYSR